MTPKVTIRSLMGTFGKVFRKRDYRERVRKNEGKICAKGNFGGHISSKRDRE